MKILSITPYQYNNVKISEKNNFYYNRQQNFDSVSFQAKKAKLKIPAGENMINEYLKNAHGDLGTKVKELMANPFSRNVFTTTLIAMAAAVTELIVKNTDEIKEKDTEKIKPDNIAAKKERKNTNRKNTEVTQDTDDTKTEHKKPGRKSVVEKMGEKIFIEKLKEMASKGYTLEQMGEELNGTSTKTVSRYLKQYGISSSSQKQERTNTNNSDTDNKTASTQKIADEKEKKDEKAKSQEEKIKLFIEQNPERSKYIKELSKFSDLSVKYDSIILDTVLHPKDETYAQILDGTEKIFKYICGLPPRYRKKYFDVINTKYISNLNQISIIANNLNAGKSVQEFLAELTETDISADIINQWVQYPGFTVEELSMTANLSDDKKAQIHEVKKAGTFKFEIFKDEERNNYKFTLRFTDKIPLSEKLKTISHFHEALYGNIYIHKDAGNKMLREISLKQELLYLLNKDKNLDSVYNILQFISPNMLSDCQNTKEKDLSPKELEESNAILRNRLETIVSKLNINENPKMQDLEDLINDDEAFGDIIGNSHAKLRLISRFVLNKDLKNKDLFEECSKAVNNLERDIEHKLSEGCIVFPYTNGEDTAPSFYLNKSKLGDFIKITLNNHGQIHTIFEDGNKKNRQQKA